MTSAARPWYHAPWMVALISVIAAPVGLVLLWMRDGKPLGKLLGTVLIASLGLAQASLLGFIRWEFSGEGMVPRPRWASLDSHYSRIERNREEQRKQVPVAESAAPGVAATQPEPPAAAAPSPTEPATAADSAPVSPAIPSSPASLAPILSGSWTNFRGPQRDGVYRGPAILTDWPSSGPKLLWKIPVGGGYASMVVDRGKVVTIEQRRNQEVVAAYDLATGRELWTNAWNAEFRETLGGDGPRATPTWDNGRVYALGAEGEFRCIDGASGRTLWSRNILTDAAAPNLKWGMSAAPLIVGDSVIVLPGGANGKSVAAYNKHTGAPLWSSLDDPAGYASPRLVTLAGEPQVVLMTGKRVVSVSPSDGKLYWEHPWSVDFDINAAEPVVVSPSRVIVSSGYGKGAALLEISKEGPAFRVQTIWENKNLKNKFNSSVFYEGHVYGLDEGILACIQASTGERRWKGGRYGFGQLILADGHLIVLTEQGRAVLVKAVPDSHRELASFQAIEEGKTWNHPALAGGLLLVRNTTEMACYDLRR